MDKEQLLKLIDDNIMPHDFPSKVSIIMAIKELIRKHPTPTKEGAKTAYDVLSKYLESCYLTHGEKLSDKYKPYLLKAMQEHATQQLAEKEAEIKDLKRWKAEQMAVFSPLLDYGQKEMSFPLGSSIVTEILKQLKATKSDGQRYGEGDFKIPASEELKNKYGITYSMQGIMAKHIFNYLHSKEQEPKGSERCNCGNEKIMYRTNIGIFCAMCRPF